MSVDVLALEFTTDNSRDTIVSNLVCEYLRLQGLRVAQGSILLYRELVALKRPKVIYLTNPHGSQIKHNAVKDLASAGHLVLTSTAEGNFHDWNDRIINTFVWGWNKDRVIYEKLTGYWSRRAARIAESKFPEVAGKIEVVGAIGFDQYRHVSLKPNHALLGLIDRQRYQRVVGIAGWNFGVFDPRDRRCFEEIYRSRFTEEQIERFISDRNVLNDIHLKLIQSHPETLFLLKIHPGVDRGIELFGSAFEGADQEPNVLIVRNDYPIGDCINVCDMWFAYDSTTALEGWLLDKPTLSINPSGADFPREPHISSGSPVAKTYAEVEEFVNEVLKDRVPRSFVALEEHRARAIEAVIQWNDGLNHVRMGSLIEKAVVESAKAPQARPMPFNLFRLLKFYLAPLAKPFLGKRTFLRDRYPYRFLEQGRTSREFRRTLKKYYASHLDQYREARGGSALQ